jgi:hypothetical protein
MMIRTPQQRTSHLALLTLSLALPACGKAQAQAKAEAGPEAFARVPVPSADGPKIVALRDVPIFELPSTGAKKLGELGLGFAISRSLEPYSRTNCPGGWYAVRPKGFVCSDGGVALDARVQKLLPAGPNLDKPLPYRYGRARSENVPVYARMPTALEQLAAEPDLTKHLARSQDAEALGGAANDIPLDARFVPTGPPVLMPGGEGIENGRRTTLSWFAFPVDAAARLLPFVGDGGPRAGSLRKNSGVAVAGSFLGDTRPGTRRFAATPDGRIVPADRLRPALGSTWRGMDLENVGLPVAIVHKQGVHTYSIADAKAKRGDEEVERRSIVPMTNKFRTVEGVKFMETRGGDWLRAQDVLYVVKRGKYPDFVRAGQKWIDVSIANQTLTAYEGTKAIYVTLISSGRDQLKDPATSASTVRGVFRVRRKDVSRAIDPREVHGLDVADAPWVMEFEPGYAFMGTYWGDGIGDPQTFHNVAMTPVDAHRIWAWADPQLPEGWKSVEDAGGTTTIVNIRP